LLRLAYGSIGEMSRPLSELEDVDWGSLAGAYGPGGRGVAAGLRGVYDRDEDARMDALDVLQSHVCHQGDIYEVTPYVIPFATHVVDDPRAPARGDVALFLAVVAESARRYSQSAVQEERNLGARTLRTLSDERDSIGRWWSDPDASVVEAAISLGWLVEGLHGPLVTHLKSSGTSFESSHFVALALLPARSEAWALERAFDAIMNAPVESTRVAAALLVQLSGAPTDVEVSAKVDTLTAPAKRELLPPIFDIPPFDFSARSVSGPLAAEVLFAGDGLFVAVTRDGRRFTVRWPGSGLEKGEMVELHEVTVSGIAQRVVISGRGEMRFESSRGFPVK